MIFGKPNLPTLFGHRSTPSEMFRPTRPGFPGMTARDRLANAMTQQRMRTAPALAPSMPQPMAPPAAQPMSQAMPPKDPAQSPFAKAMAGITRNTMRFAI